MADKKKRRKSITLDMKLKIIRVYDEGVIQAEIGQKLGFTRTTVNTVTKNREKIVAEVNTTTIRKRDSIVADMERLLIENQTTRHVPVNQAIIQSKVLSLLNDLKAKKGEAAKDAEFVASRGWFDRFKKRSNLHNIKVQGEAAAADTEAAESYPSDFANNIEDGGYSMDQFFNVDETGLFWKKMPARTFIARQEKSMPGYKPAKDRITLLLGGNASELKAYCKDNNIPFSILLFVDNAPGHPRMLDELNPNIRVEFLPPNTTSLLQPMDQCVIAAFKLNYLKRTFSKCIPAIDKEEGAGQEVLSKFWKSYNILDCIKTVRDAWNDIKGMARQLELDVETEDDAELLASHTELLSNGDLLELEEEREEENVQNGVETID
ncbi:tigger transposable element-derived protein 1-like [Bombina bombina]|uniref:tigger transposable element-derived protein 1-like n=1 Tax=Bombina bombina TaxID=8345 RepID=UPI00235B18D1|nr:tigger transposable element-derived protein 1-like [Bombina bombina]